jgi:hypothetical protein
MIWSGPSRRVKSDLYLVASTLLTYGVLIRLELSRDAASEPQLVGLIRVYKDYYPDVIVGTATVGRASAFAVSDWDAPESGLIKSGNRTLTPTASRPGVASASSRYLGSQRTRAGGGFLRERSLHGSSTRSKERQSFSYPRRLHVTRHGGRSDNPRSALNYPR